MPLSPSSHHWSLSGQGWNLEKTTSQSLKSRKARVHPWGMSVLTLGRRQGEFAHRMGETGTWVRVRISGSDPKSHPELLSSFQGSHIITARSREPGLVQDSQTAGFMLPQAGEQPGTPSSQAPRPAPGTPPAPNLPAPRPALGSPARALPGWRRRPGRARGWARAGSGSLRAALQGSGVNGLHPARPAT